MSMRNNMSNIWAAAFLEDPSSATLPSAFLSGRSNRHRAGDRGSESEDKNGSPGGAMTDIGLTAEDIIDLTSSDPEEVVEIPMSEKSSKADPRFSAERSLVRRSGKAESQPDISLASKPRRVGDRGGGEIAIDNKKGRPVVMLRRLAMNKEQKPRFYCKKCGFTVAAGERERMKLHLRNKHNYFRVVSRNYVEACTHCPEKYFTPEELIEHYRLMHVDGKKGTAIEKATSTVAADDATKGEEAEEVVVRIEVSAERPLGVAAIDIDPVEARETTTSEQNAVSSAVTYDDFKLSRTEAAVACRYCIDEPKPYATKRPFRLDAHTKGKHRALYGILEPIIRKRERLKYSSGTKRVMSEHL
jgi:hypothetical protein